MLFDLFLFHQFPICWYLLCRLQINNCVPKVISDTRTLNHMYFRACSSKLLFDFSTRMNKKKSSRNAFSAQHLVATHEVTTCRSEALHQERPLCENPTKKRCKVPYARKLWHAIFPQIYGCCCTMHREEWGLQFLPNSTVNSVIAQI